MFMKILVRCESTGETRTRSVQKQGNFITLGRMGCDININTDLCSRSHAVISEVPGIGLVLTDLGSTNGTYVNRKRVQKVVLKPGDKIKIGNKTVSLLSAVTKEEFLKAEKIQERVCEFERLAQNGVLVGWPGLLECRPKDG